MPAYFSISKKRKMIVYKLASHNYKKHPRPSVYNEKRSILAHGFRGSVHDQLTSKMGQRFSRSDGRQTTQFTARTWG